MQLNNITFKQVSKKELPAYVKKVKSAFAPALKKSFGPFLRVSTRKI